MLRVLNPRSRTLAMILGAGITILGMLMLIPSTLAQAMQSQSGVTGGTTSADSSSQTLFGTTISNSADLQLKTSEFGHMPIVHVYYTGLPASNAWSTGMAEANHSAVIVSFNASPSSILSGADDSALEHFFNTAPTGEPIYYSYFHEPEDNIARGEFTAAAYKSAWAHVVTLADAAHNPDLHSTLILMAYDLDPYAHRNWQDYLPSGGIISTLSWDAYPDWSGYGTPTPASFMGAAVAASKAAGIPFGISEFNTATVTGRPGWYSTVANYCISNGALFCTLYDSTIVGGLLKNGGTFWVSDGPSIAAWKQIVASS